MLATRNFSGTRTGNPPGFCRAVHASGPGSRARGQHGPFVQGRPGPGGRHSGVSRGLTGGDLAGAQWEKRVPLRAPRAPSQGLTDPPFTRQRRRVRLCLVLVGNPRGEVLETVGGGATRSHRCLQPLRRRGPVPGEAVPPDAGVTPRRGPCWKQVLNGAEGADLVLVAVTVPSGRDYLSRGPRSDSDLVKATQPPAWGGTEAAHAARGV